MFCRCTCSNCSVDIATKKEECICCKEIDRVGEVMENIERAGDCITLHPGFQDVCLNRWVAEVASLILKTKAGKSYRAIFSQGLRTKPYDVTIQMKALCLYLDMVLFVLQNFTK